MDMCNGLSQVYCIMPEGKIHEYTKGQGLFTLLKVLIFSQTSGEISLICRPLVKSAYQIINFLISQPEHMLWVSKEPS